MKKIINGFLYNGLSKEDYRNAIPTARTANRKSVVVFSFIGFSAFFLVALMKLNSDVGIGSLAFLVVAAPFLLMAIISLTLGKRHTFICDLFAFFIVALILGVGIYSGISQPTQRTTLLLVFFVLSSFMFSFRVIWSICITIVAELVFLLLLAKTQTGAILFENTVNSVIFSFVGICSAVYLMHIKYNGFNSEYKNKILLERDPLTLLYNRYSFNLEAERLTLEPPPVTLCMFDINGLKQINDSIGHAAGDELICAAAQCISEVFGQYGNVFRLGGDEFVAILPGELNDAKRLTDLLSQKGAAFKGKYISGVSIACGIAVTKPDISFSAALIHADSLMYEDKRKLLIGQ